MPSEAPASAAGTGTGAGVPPGAPPTPPETPPAKDSKAVADGETRKSSQVPAKPGEPTPTDDDKGPVPYSRFKEGLDKNKELKTQLEALAEKGIVDVEAAELLQEQAEEGRELLDMRRTDPVAFARQWYEQDPESYQLFGGTLIRRGIQDYLQEQAKAYRGDDKAPEAEFLDKLATGLRNGQTAREPHPEQQRLQQERTRFESEREAAFNTDMKSENRTRVIRQIDELTADTPFAPGEEGKEQKNVLYELVLNELAETLDKDPTFNREMDRLCDARNGHTRAQLAQVVKYCERMTVAGGRLQRILGKKLSALSLQAVKANQDRTKVPPDATNRREAAPGVGAGGTATVEDRARLKSQIDADYSAGKISREERGARMLRLPVVGGK